MNVRKFSLRQLRMRRCSTVRHLTGSSDGVTYAATNTPGKLIDRLYKQKFTSFYVTALRVQIVKLKNMQADCEL